jgi:hypothetical protein
MVKISVNRLDMETKRVERPQLKNYSETLVTLSASATTTLDVSLGNIFAMSQDVDITTLSITNVPSTGTVCVITIIRTKDATATTRNITWPSSFTWSNGTIPTLTQTSSAVDIITATTKDSGTTWMGFVAGLNMM